MASISAIPSLCGKHQAPDLRCVKSFQKDPMLEYLTEEEWAGVAAAWDHPKLWDTALAVCEEKFDPLFGQNIFGYPTPRALSYVLIAAYCQGQFESVDLANAMLIHRLFTNFQRKDFEIVRFPRVIAISASEAERRLYKAIKSSDVSQRLFIQINCAALDPYTNRLFHKNFIWREGDKIALQGVDLSEEKVRVCSFQICQKLYTTLTPVIHLTPTRADMESHIRANRSDAAIFFPDEEVVVHGSRDQGLFSFAHDVFHAAHREEKGNKQKEMMEWAARLALDLSFEKKCAPVVDSAFTQFKAIPTVEEYANWLMNEIHNAITDGFVESVESLLSNLEGENTIFAVPIFRTRFPKEMKDVEKFILEAVSIAQTKIRENVPLQGS